MTEQKPAPATLEIPMLDAHSKVSQMRALVGAATAFGKLVNGPDQYASVALCTALIYELQMAGVPPENVQAAIAKMVELQLPVITQIVEADCAAYDQAEAAEAVKQ